MLIGEFDTAELGQRLRSGGLGLRLYPFTVRVSSRIGALASTLHQMYARFPLVDAGFADFHVTVRRRRWFKRQAVFELDGYRPFLPLPADQVFPLFEWGLNWCIVHHVQDFLILHAAVLERDGAALILPGPPGAGKSTLTAGLACAGWRLLSDELTLLRLDDGAVQGMARPISLKNESIPLVRELAPEAIFSPVAHDTAKGTVCHLAPPASALASVGRTATPRWFVLPRFQAGAEARLEALGRAQAFMAAADFALNYSVLGAAGFDLLTSTIDRCEPYSLTFGSLAQAVAILSDLTISETGEASVS